jgi:hypothetical protein
MSRFRIAKGRVGICAAAAREDERGMTTAEYAVGTVATVTLVGGLISIFSNPDFIEMLWSVLKAIFAFIISLITGESGAGL